MTDIIEKCEFLIEELSKFADDLLYLGPPILDDRLEIFEKKIGFFLPFDFKYLLTKHNGISLNGTEIYGIDVALRGSSLDALYEWEHYEAGNPMPEIFFPFSPDGFGNHYCLDLSKLSDGLCPIVFWQHDCDHTLYEVELCNNSFSDWIKEVMIACTLEEYNYDGTEK